MPVRTKFHFVRAVQMILERDKLFPLILRWIANSVESFGFTLIQNRLPLSSLNDLRDGFGKQANALQYFHKRMTVESRCFGSAHKVGLGFTSSNTIPPTSASAPTAGGMK